MFTLSLTLFKQDIVILNRTSFKSLSGAKYRVLEVFSIFENITVTMKY